MEGLFVYDPAVYKRLFCRLAKFQAESGLLEPFDQVGVKAAGVDDLIDGAVLVAHVRQLVIARPKAKGGDAQGDGGDGVGAEIPEGIFAGGAAKAVCVGGSGGLREGGARVELPGEVKRLVFDGLAGPAGAMQPPDLPGGALASHQRVHLGVDGGLGFAGRDAAVEVDFTFRRHRVEAGGDAGNAREHQRAARGGASGEAGVGLLYALDDFGHLVNGVVALFGGRAVRRDALGGDGDLGFALVTQRDLVARGFADDGEVGAQGQFLEEVLEVFAVAVFFEDGAGDVDALPGGQPQAVGEDGRVQRGGQPGFHIHRAASPQAAIDQRAAEGRHVPLGGVIDGDGVDVRVEQDAGGAVTEAPDHAAEGIDGHAGKAEGGHLGGDQAGDGFFLAGVGLGLDEALGEGDEVVAEGIEVGV